MFAYLGGISTTLVVAAMVNDKAVSAVLFTVMAIVLVGLHILITDD